MPCYGCVRCWSACLPQGNKRSANRALHSMSGCTCSSRWCGREAGGPGKKPSACGGAAALAAARARALHAPGWGAWELLGELWPRHAGWHRPQHALGACEGTCWLLCQVEYATDGEDDQP